LLLALFFGFPRLPIDIVIDSSSGILLFLADPNPKPLFDSPPYLFLIIPF